MNRWMSHEQYPSYTQRNLKVRPLLQMADREDSLQIVTSIDRCPIDTLPNEILSEIHSSAVHLHEGERERHQFPSVLCKVSHRWKEVVYSTPKAWSFILLSHLSTPEHVHARIARTGSVPLTIKIRDNIYTIDPASAMVLLAPESGRWESLWIDVHTTSYIPHLPKQLPFLRRMHLGGHGPVIESTISLPQLRYMKFKDTQLGWPPPTSIPKLTELHAEDANMSIETLRFYLGNLPQLEVLNLSCAWLTVPDQDLKLRALLSQTVELPQLKTLVLNTFFPWEIVALLSSLWIPALRKLVVRFAERDQGEIRPFLGIPQLYVNLPRLQELGLGSLHVLKEDAEHFLLQLPETDELVIIDSPTGAPGFGFEAILMNPALAKITSRVSKLTTSGVPIPTMLQCLSSPSLPATSHRLRDEVTFKIHSSVFKQSQVHRDGVPDDDSPWPKLRQLLSHLEVTDEDISDYGSQV